MNAWHMRTRRCILVMQLERSVGVLEPTTVGQCKCSQTLRSGDTHVWNDVTKCHDFESSHWLTQVVNNWWMELTKCQLIQSINIVRHILLKRWGGGRNKREGYTSQHHGSLETKRQHEQRSVHNPIGRWTTTSEPTPNLKTWRLSNWQLNCLV